MRRQVGKHSQNGDDVKRIAFKKISAVTNNARLTLNTMIGMWINTTLQNAIAFCSKLEFPKLRHLAHRPLFNSVHTVRGQCVSHLELKHMKSIDQQAAIGAIMAAKTPMYIQIPTLPTEMLDDRNIATLKITLIAAYSSIVTIIQQQFKYL